MTPLPAGQWLPQTLHKKPVGGCEIVRPMLRNHVSIKTPVSPSEKTPAAQKKN
jgi:hypothetical protein